MFISPGWMTSCYHQNHVAAVELQQQQLKTQNLAETLVSQTRTLSSCSTGSLYRESWLEGSFPFVSEMENCRPTVKDLHNLPSIRTSQDAWYCPALSWPQPPLILKKYSLSMCTSRMAQHEYLFLNKSQPKL